MQKRTVLPFNYAFSGLHGCDIAVQLRRGAEHARRVAGQSHANPNARCQHHGQQATREHHAVRYVLIDGESYGGISYCGRVGCVDADAVRSGDPSAVGARRADSLDC